MCSSLALLTMTPCHASPFMFPDILFFPGSLVCGTPPAVPSPGPRRQHKFPVTLGGFRKVRCMIRYTSSIRLTGKWSVKDRNSLVKASGKVPTMALMTCHGSHAGDEKMLQAFRFKHELLLRCDSFNSFDHLHKSTYCDPYVDIHVACQNSKRILQNFKSAKVSLPSKAPDPL